MQSEKVIFPACTEMHSTAQTAFSLSIHTILAPLLPFRYKLMVFTVEDLCSACHGLIQSREGNLLCLVDEISICCSLQSFPNRHLHTHSPHFREKLSPAILTAISLFSFKPLRWSQCLQENNLTMIKLPLYYDLCPTR